MGVVHPPTLDWPKATRGRKFGCSATHLPSVMRPNRRPAAGRFFSGSAIDSLHILFGPITVPYRFGRRRLHERFTRWAIYTLYLRAALETGTGVRELGRKWILFRPPRSSGSAGIPEALGFCASHRFAVRRLAGIFFNGKIARSSVPMFDGHDKTLPGQKWPRMSQFTERMTGHIMRH